MADSEAEAGLKPRTVRVHWTMPVVQYQAVRRLAKENGYTFARMMEHVIRDAFTHKVPATLPGGGYRPTQMGVR